MHRECHRKQNTSGRMCVASHNSAAHGWARSPLSSPSREPRAAVKQRTLQVPKVAFSGGGSRKLQGGTACGSPRLFRTETPRLACTKPKAADEKRRKILRWAAGLGLRPCTCYLIVSSHHVGPRCFVKLFSRGINPTHKNVTNIVKFNFRKNNLACSNISDLQST